MGEIQINEIKAIMQEMKERKTSKKIRKIKDRFSSEVALTSCKMKK